MSVETEYLLKKLRKDEKVKRLEENFETVSYFRLPREQLKSEIETAHRMRPIRSLKASGDFAMKIIEACAADQATRSRLSEISLQAFRAEKALQNALDALRDYLIVEYDSELRAFRTKEERLRIIDLTLRRYIKYFEDVKAIQSMCALIIADIDKAAWSLKLTVDAMQMLNRPEITV